MRFKNALTVGVALSLCGSTTVVQAYPIVNPTSSLLSAFKDTSNFWSSTTSFGFNLYNGPSDPDLYINAINFVPGSGYDNNIGLVGPGGTTYQTGFGSYTLGTPLAPNTLMYLYDAVSRSGDVDPGVANGTYDFNLKIIGGNSSSATDVLGDIPYQIQIANGIKVSVKALASPGAISSGQTSTINMTVTNDDPTQTFVSTTWFVSNFSNGSNELPFGGFTGDWFDKSILPGQSRTDGQSFRFADDTTPLGTYSGPVGVVGGLVNGDTMYIAANPDPVIQVVVPEPAVLGTMLVVAGLAMCRRHRI